MQKRFPWLSICLSLTYMNKLNLVLFVSKRGGKFSKYSNTISVGSILMVKPSPEWGTKPPDLSLPSEWKLNSDTLFTDLTTSIYTIK